MSFSDRTDTFSAISSAVMPVPRSSAARFITFGDSITATWFSR